MNNSRILTIRNAKFSGYYFYINLNIWGDFQICFGVPLKRDFSSSKTIHFNNNCTRNNWLVKWRKLSFSSIKSHKRPLTQIYDELFLRNGWPTKGIYALFPAGTIVRDSHHRKSSTRRQYGLNLRRIWVQTLLNEVV